MGVLHDALCRPPPPPPVPAGSAPGGGNVVIKQVPGVLPMTVVIPYQGCVGYSTSLPVVQGSSLTNNVLCYAPNTTNVLLDNPVNPATTRGNCLKPKRIRGVLVPLEVPFQQLVDFPCALTFLMTPILPIRGIKVELLDAATNATLGVIQTLDTGNGYSRAPPGRPWSYCLNWGGIYTQPDGSKGMVVSGRNYTMRAQVEAPLAQADKVLGLQPRIIP
eukprot:gene9488-9652_t